MKTIVGSTLLLGTLLISAPVFAETKTFTMPDGSQTIVDIPPGMTYTKEQVLRSWQLKKKLDMADLEEQTAKQPKPTYGAPSTYSQIAALEGQSSNGGSNQGSLEGKLISEIMTGRTADGRKLYAPGVEARVDLLGVLSGQGTPSRESRRIRDLQNEVNSLRANQK
jgi:hypothetical protein